ncbi:MAG: hypothetical protein WCF20_08855 [Methylovirgula sp.]
MVTTIPRQARPLRSLTNLRTMTGARGTQTEPYQAFLRISFLELERTRHRQEMQKVHRRADTIVARCCEIEREKARILAGMRESLTPPHTPQAADLREATPRQRKFHLSY